MRNRRVARCGAASLLLALVASLALAGPTFAWQAEGGTKNCGYLISFLHGRYNDIAALAAPGAATQYHLENDNQWHVHEHNGDYAGNWSALGDPLLDFNGTYVGCRNYG